jgi:redox-sensitive bicupin YhaK (pirin superfamily)
MYVSFLEDGKTVTHTLSEGRGLYVQVASGALEVSGELAEAGDAFTIEGGGDYVFKANSETEFVLFDLAMEFKY